MSVLKTMTVAAGLAVALLSSAPAFAGASTGTWKYSPREIRHEQMRQRYNEPRGYYRAEPRGYYRGRHEGWNRGYHRGWDNEDRY